MSFSLTLPSNLLVEDGVLATTVASASGGRMAVFTWLIGGNAVKMRRARSLSSAIGCMSSPLVLVLVLVGIPSVSREWPNQVYLLLYSSMSTW